MVLGRKSGTAIQFTDPLTGQGLAEAAPGEPRGATKKITLNNPMRVALRLAIAAGNHQRSTCKGRTAGSLQANTR